MGFNSGFKGLIGVVVRRTGPHTDNEGFLYSIIHKQWSINGESNVR